MKKIFYSALFLTAVTTANAQVKVGNNPTTINASSVLEVESTNQGFLLPRIALTATTTPTLVGGAHVAGMTVYNTATAGDVTPGYYYNDGTKWVRLANSANFWSLTGNAGTTPPTSNGTPVSTSNFWGTTDAQNLAVGTNGVTRAIFDQNNSLFGGDSTFSQSASKYSIVWGYRDTAFAGSPDSASAVFGSLNKVYGANSLVSGNSNIDSSINSFVFGLSNNLGAGTGGNVQRNGGVIMGGGNNVVTGISYNSIVNGSRNTLTGAAFENIVGGFQNTLNGSQKMIVSGQGNTITGALYSIVNCLNCGMAGSSGSIMVGNVNNVNANYSDVLGSNNIINTGSDFSTAIGSGNTVAASNANSWAIGTNSTTTAASQYVSNFSGGYQYYIAPSGNTTAATPAMVITSAGRVGIGTAAPGNLLDVDGNVNGNVVARIYNTNAGSSATSLLSFGVDANQFAAYIFAGSSTYTGGGGARSLNIVNASTTAPITFSTSGGELLRLAGNGNVGIGTTAPTSKLQVVGLPTYASDAAAGTGGLTTGAFFADASGGVHVKL